MLNQIGLSPKLYPCLAGIVIGGVVIALGEKQAGIGILVTGAGALIAGYHAPAGQIATQHPMGGSDSLLSEEVVKQISGVVPTVAATVSKIGSVGTAAGAATTVLETLNTAEKAVQEVTKIPLLSGLLKR